MLRGGLAQESVDLPVNWKVYPRCGGEAGRKKGKRQVEVFTAGCPVCDPAVSLVNDLASPDCEVTVYDLRESGVQKATEYGIRTEGGRAQS